MAENTKTPNQDRQRSSQGDPNKPQKPGGTVPSSNPDRSRHGNRPETDPDRDRQGVNRPEIERDRQVPGKKPMSSGKDGVVDVDDLDDDDAATQPIDRE